MLIKNEKKINENKKNKNEKYGSIKNFKADKNQKMYTVLLSNFNPVFFIFIKITNFYLPKTV